MELKVHVDHGFNTDPALDQINFGSGVIAFLTTNAAIFPSLPFPVAELTKRNDLLRTTYADFQNKGEAAKGDYINARYSWKQAYRKTADYVDVVADGNLAVINKSGFKPTKERSDPSQHLEALSGFNSHGNAKAGFGKVVSEVDKHPDLRAYIFTIADKSATINVIDNQLNVIVENKIVFSLILNTKAIANFEGLTSLNRMFAQAAGFNTAGLGDFTQAVEVSVP